MTKLPPVELLESVHQFPGPYLFKAIGKSEKGFAARAVAAVRDEIASPTDPPFTIRESKGGRHVSVSVEANVLSAHEVLAVYRRLSALSGLVLLW